MEHLIPVAAIAVSVGLAVFFAVERLITWRFRQLEIDFAKQVEILHHRLDRRDDDFKAHVRECTEAHSDMKGLRGALEQRDRHITETLIEMKDDIRRLEETIRH